MTVKYASAFATNSSVGAFTTLLFRWRGSVWKLIWSEYLAFITLFYMFSFVYRFALSEEQQKFFEKVAHYCENSKKFMSMAFVLGFFVSSIVNKWWQMYHTIPWPNHVALFMNCNIRGTDAAAKAIKKTVVRLCNLSLMLTFLKISPPLKRLYPTLDHLVKKGLLTEKEKVRMEKMDRKTTQPTNWLPVAWATELLMDEEKVEGRVSNCCWMIVEINKFRHGCTLLLDYEHCSVPLAYIQVVTIAVYTYFFSCLFGRQWLVRDENLKNLDLYFPFLTTLEFIFYVGWLKVAESLINPFGGDDDDLELDEIIHRHIEVTTKMVSTCDDEDYDRSIHDLKDSSKDSELTNETSIDCEKVFVQRVDSNPPAYGSVLSIDEVDKNGSLEVILKDNKKESLWKTCRKML